MFRYQSYFRSVFVIFASVMVSLCFTLSKSNSSKNSPYVPPKVSVIMPVYNAEKYLKESIESVLNSTLKEIELICVDYGSEDSSLEILKDYAYKDSRVVVINQKNEGVAVAKQSGIDRANGEYITFIEPCDTIDLEAYKVAYKRISKSKADIVCFGWRTFSDRYNDETLVNDFKLGNLKAYKNWWKAKKHIGSTHSWNKLYRRSLIVENGVKFGDSNLKFSLLKIFDDEKFNLCAYSQAKKIVYMPNVFYNCRLNAYRLVESNLIFKMSPSRLIKNYEDMWKCVNDYYQQHGVKVKNSKKWEYFFSVYRSEVMFYRIPPKVSVIMPVYNAEKYLKESIESVLNSTLKNIELICVNDGSKDNSLKILKQYAKKDSRVVVVNQKNKGEAGARQTGLNAARGEFFANIDPDDRVDPEAYEIAYDYMNKYKADIVVYGWRNFSDDGSKIIRNDFKFDKLKIYKNKNWWIAKKYRGSIYSWNKLYRRSFIVNNDISFFVDLKIANDEGFNLCAYSKARKIVCIPHVLHNYRQNSSGAMFNTSIGRLMKNHRKMWKYVDDYYEKHNVKISTFKKLTYFLSVYRDEFWPLVKTLVGAGT